MFALTLPSHADSTATTTCQDGTTSTAKGKGACSGHGGVQKATTADAPAAAAVATPAPAAAAAMAAPPAGATAKCKDGTFSTSKSHSGACSKHGGVADWLTPAK